MTNADKYLKDDVSIEELITTMENELPLSYVDAVQFWKKTIKPTLTEDERVILRNAKGEEYIFRDKGGNLWTRDEIQSDNDFCQFNHLFQFIKEGETYEIKELLNEDIQT